MESAEYQRMDAIEQIHPWFVAKRKYLRILLDQFGITKGLKILDVGCGTGAIMEFLRQEGYDAHGIDPSEEALAYCHKKGLAVTEGNANAIRYPDNTFDVVLALDVLEHLDDDCIAVEEAARVLKSDGLFVATVPAHQFMWSYHDELLHHKRRYTRPRLRQALAGSLQIKYISWIHAGILLPQMIIRILKKMFVERHATSEVMPVSTPVRVVLGAVYAVELLIFKILGRLPFGLSLIVVARKS